jgi:hypothetical protein
MLLLKSNLKENNAVVWQSSKQEVATLKASKELQA